MFRIMYLANFLIAPLNKLRPTIAMSCLISYKKKKRLIKYFKIIEKKKKKEEKIKQFKHIHVLGFHFVETIIKFKARLYYVR